MIINITGITDTGKLTSTGKKTYHVQTPEGQHVAYGDWPLQYNGKQADVKIQPKNFKGVSYTVIWPVDEAPIVTPLPEVTRPAIEPKPTPPIPPVRSYEDSTFGRIVHGVVCAYVTYTGDLEPSEDVWANILKLAKRIEKA